MISENSNSFKDTIDKFIFLFSTEAEDNSSLLAGEIDKTPPGGNTASDEEPNNFDEGNAGSNEQINDLSFGSGADETVGGNDDTGGMENTDSSASDTSSSDDNTPNKFEHLFKNENGKMALEDLMQSLQLTVEDTLNKIVANDRVNSAVVDNLEILLDNIKKMRQVIYIQPIEKSMYDLSLCVKEYKNLTRAMAINLDSDIRKLNS